MKVFLILQDLYCYDKGELPLNKLPYFNLLMQINLLSLDK